MVLKCKMCGGDIEPISQNTGKCLYCKSVMTLPNLDDDKIINLFNRANDLRLNNNFDKAKEVYENILQIDNKQIEAYWGLLLCKYGVEYVDDPKTKTKIPTCHRTNEDPILTDQNYKKIKKESYGEALELYEKEAKKIDEIQKRIITISVKEKPYDVFICYKETDEKGERTHDSVIAQDIYDKLIEQGLKVFFARITLEDKLGQEYEPYIYSALKSSKVMLVVGTKEEYFNAIWVKNEWNRYLEMMKKDKGKVLIPVYSKIDAYKLPEEFAMLQAQSMDKVGAIQDLTRGIKKVINEYKNPELNDVDEETVARVQKALEEAKSIGNGQYEVSIVKEKLPVWYYVLCVFAISAYIIFRLLSLVDMNFISLLTLGKFDIFSNKMIQLIEFIILIILAVYFIGLFINRKTHKFCKKIFPILLSLPIFKMLILLENNIIVYSSNHKELIINIFLFYICDIIALLVSHLIVPKWNLDTSSKAIMNKEDKDKQIEKNNYIRKNFKMKEKNSKPNKIMIISLLTIIVLLSISVFIKVNRILPFNQSNLQNSSITQIHTLGKKKIYSSPSLNSKVLLTVLKNGYYDISDTEEIKVNKYLNTYGFVKIKTNKSIEGYLYLGEEKSYDYGIDYKIICGKNDIKCQEKFTYSNKRNEKENQLIITNETLNLRTNHSTSSNVIVTLKKDDIYTIQDSYIEKVTEKRKHKDYDNFYSSHFMEYVDVVVDKRTWYKIKTSNNLEGWICGNYEDEKYIELLEQK